MDTVYIFFGLISFSLAIYAGLSIKRLKRNQAGAIFDLGKEEPERVEKGPKTLWVPKGFKELKRVSTKPQIFVIPPPDKIQLDMNKPLEEGKFYPIEISHKPYDQAKYFHDTSDPKKKQQDEEQGPTVNFEDLDDTRKEAIKMDQFNQRNTSRVIAAISIGIDADDKKSMFYFFKNTGTFEKARKGLDGITRAILGDTLSTVTLGESIGNKSLLSRLFQKELEKRVQEGSKRIGQDIGEPLGFKVNYAVIQQIDPDEKVKAAVDESSAEQAKINTEQEKNQAAAKNLVVMSEARLTEAKNQAKARAAMLQEIGDVITQSDGAKQAYQGEIIKEGLKGAAFVDADRAITLVFGKEGMGSIASPPKHNAQTTVK